MADRYWVGGTASWDGTAGTKWATTSGGAGGAAVPTSADNVFFDAASGAVTVTVSATANCLDLNFTGFTGTFAGSSTVNIYGSFVAVAAMTWTHSSTLNFQATTTGKTITTNGKTLTSSLNFVGTGGGWTLQDALTNTQSSGILIQRGTFTTNNNNINTTIFNSNYTNARTINLGSSTITCTSTLSAVNFDAATNLTLNSGTSTFIITSSVGNFLGGGFTFYNLTFSTGNTVGAVNSTLSGNNTFNNLSITPTGNATKQITLSGNQTVNGTFTSTGGSVRYRNTIKSDSTTARTITAAAVSIQDTDFLYITGAGAASPFALSAQRVGNCGGNSGITFPAAVNRYAVSAGNYYDTTTWSATSGGAAGASVPLPQDTAYFNSLSGAGTYTLNIGSNNNVGTIDCTGFTRTLTGVAGATTNIYGSLTLSSGMTFTSSTTTFIFAGISSYSIDCQGQSLYNTTINSLSGTYSLSSNFSNTNILNITSSFSTNNYNITSNTVSCSASVSFGSSTITVTAIGNGFTAVNGVVNAGTSTIVLLNTTTTARTFQGGTNTYNNLVIGGTTGISTLTFTGSATFNTISSTKTVAHTILFTAGTTTTVADFTVDGTSGNVVTLGSTTASPATLVKTGGGFIAVDYASISNLTASPSSTWYATNSTDGGGNSGWTFGAPPVGNGLLFGSNF